MNRNYNSTDPSPPSPALTLILAVSKNFHSWSLRVARLPVSDSGASVTVDPVPAMTSLFVWKLTPVFLPFGNVEENRNLR